MSIGGLSKRDQAVLQRESLEQRYRLGRTLIKAAATVWSLYILRDAAFELAGKETAFALKVAILGDFKFAATLTLAGAASVWAAAERMLRHRKTEVMSSRILELEKTIDKDRTSSGITSKGKTNPRDK